MFGALIGTLTAMTLMVLVHDRSMAALDQSASCLTTARSETAS